MAGIIFSNIPTVWKDCTGYSPKFASEQVETYVSMPASAFSTSQWVNFTSPQLREALFHEATHYVDRALYQLVIGKNLVSQGRLSWGLVAYYYSSFFSAQAAIRFKGIYFVKVNYDSETKQPPTHRLEVVNLFTNNFQIRKAKDRGEHVRVWNTFYEEFHDISALKNWNRYAVITAEEEQEARLVEMHQRHLVNYVPGRGYIELRSPDVAEKLQLDLSGDIISDQADALDDDFKQMEMRAFLRLRLCLQILKWIDEQEGVYHIHHPTLTCRRRKWLNKFDCPNKLSSHLEDVLI